MKYDSSLDSGAEFNNADGTISQAYVAGNYYDINIGSGNRVYVYCVISETGIFVDYAPLADGGFINSAGTVIWKLWNGDGWGDDNKFNVVDGISTTTDDNSAITLIGQKRTKIHSFIGEEE